MKTNRSGGFGLVDFLGVDILGVDILTLDVMALPLLKLVQCIT